MSSGTLNSIPKKEHKTQVNIPSQVWQCIGRILIANKATLIQDAVEVKWAIVKFMAANIYLFKVRNRNSTKR